jgi:hypothetical protein
MANFREDGHFRSAGLKNLTWAGAKFGANQTNTGLNCSDLSTQFFTVKCAYALGLPLLFSQIKEAVQKYDQCVKTLFTRMKAKI